MKKDELIKDEMQWLRKLSPESYRVTRLKATEPAFTGRYWDSKEAGTYHCICCGTPLFDSTAKFDSGTGWPSFNAPVTEDKIATDSDTSHGMRRTEVLCSHCDAHLGHVFEDGPEPTGQRYCINSVALKLNRQKKK